MIVVSLMSKSNGFGAGENRFVQTNSMNLISGIPSRVWISLAMSISNPVGLSGYGGMMNGGAGGSAPTVSTPSVLRIPVRSGVSGVVAASWVSVGGAASGAVVVLSLPPQPAIAAARARARARTKSLRMGSSLLGPKRRIYQRSDEAPSRPPVRRRGDPAPMRRALPIVLRAGFAGVAVVALAYQLVEGRGGRGVDAANFFSFFTVQSNLFAAAVLLATAFHVGTRSTRFEAVRGAAVLYMLITGVVFALLLSDLTDDLQTTVPWVNFVVHQLMPVVLLADWLLDPPRRRLAWKLAFVWLVYPLAYFAYTLGRGAIVDWYPYPFLDVNEHGYGGVLWHGAILLPEILLGAFAVIAVGNLLGMRKREP